jgi:hypothetical protein
MGRYRKKPVVVEAWQWTGADDQENLGWISEAMQSGELVFELEGEEAPYAELKQGLSTQRFFLTDWVVNEAGRLHAVNHEGFAATYERLVG